MSNKYRDFFVESDQGIKFVRALELKIDSIHRQAEDEPELSTAYTQRAKGIREVIAMIKTISSEVKKGRKEEETDVVA